MKNKKLKNSLIAASIAVATGVVLLGVNAAMSDAPAYQPPGSGVSPVFTDLQITGETTASGDVDMSDSQLYVDDIRMTKGANSYIWNDGGDDVQIHDDLFVYHSTDPSLGNIVATGNISAPGSTISGGDLSATGNLTVDGTANLRGNVYDSGGNFTINDTLNVTGSVYDSNSDLILDDGVDIRGTIIDGDSDLLINDGVDIRGNVYDNGGNFTIADTLNVTGNLYDSGGNFTIDDTVNIMGNVYDSNSYFTIDDSLNVTGTVYDSNSDFLINDGLDVRGSVYDAGGTLYLNDRTDINGHLTANSIGNFYSAQRTVWSNSWVGTDVYCNSNHILLSCFAGWIDITDSNRQWVTSTMTVTTPTNRYGCYANGQNNTGSSKRFSVYARCFDPNG